MEMMYFDFMDKESTLDAEADEGCFLTDFKNWVIWGWSGFIGLPKD